MVKSKVMDTENLQIARKLALEGSVASLSQLTNFTPSIRNSKTIYEALGNASAANDKAVINYILFQNQEEEAAALYALKALSNINTPLAERAIMKISKATLGTNRKFADCIGAEAIVALQEIGTETAADKILELGRGDDDLVLQAMISLKALYDTHQRVFHSAYKQMILFSTQPAILDRTVEPAIGERDEARLRQAFMAADKSEILHMKDYASGAFNLSVDAANLVRALAEVQNKRAALARDLE